MTTNARKYTTEVIVGNILIGVSVALFIWTFWLSQTAPHSHLRHWAAPPIDLGSWTLTWVGLDLAEATGLLITGYLLRRRNDWAHMTAMLTMPLFVFDAWFDIMTATKRNTPEALLMALCMELPIAALLLWIGYRTWKR